MQHNPCIHAEGPPISLSGIAQNPSPWTFDDCSTEPPDPEVGRSYPIYTSTINRRRTIAPSNSTPPHTNTEHTQHIWPQLLTAHLIVFNSFGLIQASSTLAPHFKDSFNTSPAALPWTSSTPIFLAYALAPLSNAVLHYTSYRRITLFGAVCQDAGLWAGGSSRSYGVTLVFQGGLVGVGHGLTFAPAVARLARACEGRRGRMMILSGAACGAATGGLAFSGVARAMEGLGRGWTVWVVGCVVFGNAVVVQMIIERESRQQVTALEGRRSKDDTCAGKRKFEWSVLKSKSLALYTTAICFLFAGLWIPYFYIQTFSHQVLHTSSSQSFAVLMTLNAAGIPGRIIPAILATRYHQHLHLGSITDECDGVLLAVGKDKNSYVRLGKHLWPLRWWSGIVGAGWSYQFVQ